VQEQGVEQRTSVGEPTRPLNSPSVSASAVPETGVTGHDQPVYQNRTCEARRGTPSVLVVNTTEPLAWDFGFSSQAPFEDA